MRSHLIPDLISIHNMMDLGYPICYNFDKYLAPIIIKDLRSLGSNDNSKSTIIPKVNYGSRAYSYLDTKQVIDSCQRVIYDDLYSAIGEDPSNNQIVESIEESIEVESLEKLCVDRILPAIIDTYRDGIVDTLYHRFPNRYTDINLGENLKLVAHIMDPIRFIYENLLSITRPIGEPNSPLSSSKDTPKRRFINMIITRVSDLLFKLHHHNYNKKTFMKIMAQLCKDAMIILNVNPSLLFRSMIFDVYYGDRIIGSYGLIINNAQEPTSEDISEDVYFQRSIDKVNECIASDFTSNTIKSNAIASSVIFDQLVLPVIKRVSGWESLKNPCLLSFNADSEWHDRFLTQFSSKITYYDSNNRINKFIAMFNNPSIINTLGSTLINRLSTKSKISNRRTFPDVSYDLLLSYKVFVDGPITKDIFYPKMITIDAHVMTSAQNLSLRSLLINNTPMRQIDSIIDTICNQITFSEITEFIYADEYAITTMNFYDDGNIWYRWFSNSNSSRSGSLVYRASNYLIQKSSVTGSIRSIIKETLKNQARLFRKKYREFCKALQEDSTIPTIHKDICSFENLMIEYGYFCDIKFPEHLTITSYHE